MSNITIKLDTTGLRTLIADNPEFKVELMSAVMSNIKSDLLTDSLEQKLKSVFSNMVSTSGWGSTLKYQWNNDQFRKIVEQTLKERTVEVLETAVEKSVSKYLELHGQQFVRTQFTKMINEQLEGHINEDFIRRALDKKLKAALAALVDQE